MLGIYNNNINSNNSFQGIHKSAKIIFMNNCADTLKSLKKLSLAAERAVPEYGSFYKIEENFQNKVKDLDISDVQLRIKPSIVLSERPKERELEICIHSADKNTSYTIVLKRGEKQEIMDYIQNENTPSEIEKVLRTASEEFSEYNI